MKEFVIEGQKSYWGDKCSDKFRKPSATGRKPVIDDLFAYREQLLEAAARRRLPAPLPQWACRAPCRMLDRLPFWRAISPNWAFATVLSPVTDPRISAAGIEMAVAQPCYPVQVAHGHVQALARSRRGLHPGAQRGGCRSRRRIPAPRHYCPWNQTLPWVLRSAPALEPHQHKFLIPDAAFPARPGAGEEARWPKPCAASA